MKITSKISSILKIGKKTIDFIDVVNSGFDELSDTVKAEKNAWNDEPDDSSSLHEDHIDTSCEADHHSHQNTHNTFNQENVNPFKNDDASCHTTNIDECIIVDGEIEENDSDGPGSFKHSSRKFADAFSGVAASGFKDPEAVGKALGILVEVAVDTIKYVADQETKQEEIRKERDIAIAQINATSELIKQYLDRTFDERKEIFSKQFEAVDEALRTGNTQMLAISLNSINSLAAQSPFKNLADINQVMQALNNDDTVWDI